MTVYEFAVYGTPAPQGSKRHVGGGRMVESSKAVKPWREAVKWSVVEAGAGARGMLGPLEVTVCFTLPKPASAPKKRQTWPDRRPDLDKLIRATLDGIGESGLWHDDSQVVSIVAEKVYPDTGGLALPTPGARIWVSEVVA